MRAVQRNSIEFVVTLAVSLFAVDRGVVDACTPPIGGLPNYTVADHVHRTPIVLEGVVVSVDETPYGQMADVQVRQYFKGSGPTLVRISNLGPTSVCLSPVAIGDHKIFYAQGNPDSGLQAVYLSQFDAIASADPDTIAQVEAATGVMPTTPQKAASTAQSVDTSVAALGGAAVGLVIGFLVGAAGVFWAMKRSR